MGLFIPCGFEANGENALCKVLWELQIQPEFYVQIAIYKH